VGKPEGAMWQATRPLLAGLDPVRIESPMTEGNPDVNYVGGWIELKAVRTWPKRPDTPLRIDHYTIEQRAWHQRRRAAGGKVFLLLKVGETEWLLFDARTAALDLGHVSRARLYDIAIARWTRKPKKEELQQWLR
jgi:hypothetical protein